MAKYCPDPYDVAQEGSGVDITVRVVSEDGASFASSEVDATVSNAELRFTYRGETFVEGTPWSAIVEEDSLWTVETKQAKSGKGSVHIITIHLEKASEAPWPLAVRGPVRSGDAAGDQQEAKATTADDEEGGGEGDATAATTAAAAAEEESAAPAEPAAPAGDEGDGNDEESPAAKEDGEDGEKAPAPTAEDLSASLPYAADAPLDPHSLYLLANAADAGGLPLFTRAQQYAMYASASDRGSPVAKYRLWQILNDPAGSGFSSLSLEKDVEAGFAHLEASAEAGYVPAIVHCGMAHASGEGVPGNAKDAGKAAKLLERAGRLGYIGALTMAAQIYQNGGEGLEVNGPLAVELYSLAAVKGDPRAAFNLGVAYCNGCGTVKRDLDRAIAWWSKAHTMDPSLPKPETILKQLGAVGMAGSSGGGGGDSDGPNARAQAQAQAVAAAQAKANAHARQSAHHGHAPHAGAAPPKADFPIGAVLPLAAATVIFGMLVWNRFSS